MSRSRYNEKVLDHFRNPRNVGDIKEADAVGKTGNPACGDVVWIYIKLENKILKDVKFKVAGCPAAIATSSMLTTMARGKTVEEALKITEKDVEDALDGLPPGKSACSNIGVKALREAIKTYKDQNQSTD
ncbi:MAG: iron-sulfur cluster assembly scaffold protein [Candidatus Hodarchaeota archaeon]